MSNITVYYVMIDGTFAGSYYSIAAVEQLRSTNQGSKIEVMAKRN